MGEAYIVRRGGAGASRLMLYGYGTYDSKIGHVGVKTPSDARIVYNAAWITMASVANVASEMYECFGPVNVSRYSRLTMVVENAGDRNIKACAFVAASSNVLKASAIASVQEDVAAGAWATLTLDLSEVDLSNCYVYAGFNTDGSAWANARSSLRVHAVTLEV